MPTVLVIDQDAESRRSTAELFSGDEWTVLEADGGDAGIAIALRDRPQMILCDSLMPRENGFNVCRAIREQLHPARIVMVSPQGYAVDREVALASGADDYWVKPVTSAHVAEALDHLAVNGSRAPEPAPRPTKTNAQATKVKFWGVRGSIPVPGPDTVRYGGNTSCVEVRADGEIIIFDAGSGIRPLGLALEEEFGDAPINLSLLITHAHWDHIQGLPFFMPAYNEKNEIRILGYEAAQAGLGQILADQMEPPFFPLSLRDLPSTLAIDELKEMEFMIGKVRVHSKFLNHPGVCAGYRLYTSSGSISFLPDNEPYDRVKLQLVAKEQMTAEEALAFAGAERQKLIEFLSGSDLLMLDAQYTDEEYEAHIGWGHGSLTSVVDLAIDSKVKKLYLFHHDPNHDDDAVDGMVAWARAHAAKRGAAIEIEGAVEGAEVIVGG